MVLRLTTGAENTFSPATMTKAAVPLGVGPEPKPVLKVIKALYTNLTRAIKIPVTRVMPLLVIDWSKSMSRFCGKTSKADEPLMFKTTAKFSEELTGRAKFHNHGEISDELSPGNFKVVSPW